MTTIANTDANQFKQAFREEAQEILAELEQALLELIERLGDGELVARVFRGLHTIKGSGAMFGFEGIADFTHELESAFDEVRCGRLKTSAELVDVTLAALDQIRQMLSEGEDPAARWNRERAEILERVQNIAGRGSAQGKHNAENAMEVERPSLGSGRQDATRRWLIRFTPGPDLLLNGSDPILLLKELWILGAVSLRAFFEAIPPLAQLEPERCYVSWEAVLSSSCEAEAIRDVFIFVEDLCQLHIELLREPDRVIREAAVESAAKQETLARRLPEKDRGASRESQTMASSLRVPAAKLDQFVDLVGEIVTVQARLSEVASGRDDADLSEVTEQIERLTTALREKSMALRMIPIRGTFERFRRLVHDLAHDLGKKVDLIFEGAETELDKTVVERLSDPLLHLIRNSMDHGVEFETERKALGKRPVATIKLAARHSGAVVLVEVSDDGVGIDPDAVRRQATKRGLLRPEEALTEAEIYALLFEPGFSTAETVTDISGRGVGLDVVRRSVESLRGTIEVMSRKGEGTSVTLRLPLTMAIIDGLLVRIGSASFVVPLGNTLECIELTREEIERANGKHLIVVRGEILPYIRLREYFQLRTSAPELEQIMVVETEAGRFGLVVDKVLGDCQAVIKGLGHVYRHVQVVSGATILGNGTVALILDPERLIQEAVRSLVDRSRGHPSCPDRERPYEATRRPEAMQGKRV
ncbi:MAG TPA: chemotaxis protein CheA [Terracidiphilus sp.]|jgi:two-component system chemotaxis sensor kinase CheA|nr:chemotaxis protein CheA [Terracidiphilus sp.]